jgi:hypothetical protein
MSVKRMTPTLQRSHSRPYFFANTCVDERQAAWDDGRHAASQRARATSTMYLGRNVVRCSDVLGEHFVGLDGRCQTEVDELHIASPPMQQRGLNTQRIQRPPCRARRGC